jgi:hypothetical protein
MTIFTPKRKPDLCDSTLIGLSMLSLYQSFFVRSSNKHKEAK